MLSQKKITFAFVTILFAAVTNFPGAGSAVAAASQSYSGQNDSVLTIPAIKAPVIVSATYQGDSNFIVHPVYSTGEEGIAWFNEIDTWSGTIFQESDSNAIVAISIKTEGSWTLKISPLASAPVVNVKSFKGQGTRVVKFAKPSSGFKRATLTHTGDSNFIVHPIGSKGSQGYSMVNEIGIYKGTVLVPSGTQYLEIIANGSWTVSIK